MMYTAFYVMMLVGFGGLAILSPSKETQIIGGLLWAVNAIIFRTFWR